MSVVFQEHRMWPHHGIAGYSLVSPKELEFILRQIPEDEDGFCVVEIGAYCGATAAWILDRRPNVRWIAIDLFVADRQFAVMSFLVNRQAPGRRLNCFVGTAAEWYELYGKFTGADLVIVDDEHTEDACRASLEVAAQATSRIVCHDYGVPCFPGVKKAIDEFPGWEIAEQENVTVLLKRKISP